ncbi:unnamed protein product, partial [marine sediment metagenome]
EAEAHAGKENMTMKCPKCGTQMAHVLRAGYKYVYGCPNENNHKNKGEKL